MYQLVEFSAYAHELGILELDAHQILDFANYFWCIILEIQCLMCIRFSHAQPQEAGHEKMHQLPKVLIHVHQHQIPQVQA
jgi:hypothetical protein